MNGPRPDPNELPHGAYQWRVAMKSGDTWIVTADTLESFGTFGLSFRVANNIVAVVPHGQFQTCEQIEIDGATPYIRVEAASETPEAARKGSAMIRAVPTAATASLSKDVRLLISILPGDGTWIGVSVVRSTFKERIGGFPPSAYKAFNDAIAVARANGVIETTGID